MSARVKLRVDKQGRVVLPALVRDKLGLQGGGEIVLDISDDRVELSSSVLAMHRMRHELRRYVPDGVSMVDELLAERRAEAARKNAG